MSQSSHLHTAVDGPIRNDGRDPGRKESTEGSDGTAPGGVARPALSMRTGDLHAGQPQSLQTGGQIGSNSYSSGGFGQLSLPVSHLPSSSSLAAEWQPLTGRCLVKEESLATGNLSSAVNSGMTEPDRARGEQHSDRSSLCSAGVIYQREESTSPSASQTSLSPSPSSPPFHYPTQVASDASSVSSTRIHHRHPWDGIIVDPSEYRVDFKESHYDIVLIYSENDRDKALAFRDILMKFITLEDGQRPSICILDRNENLSHIASRFSHMEEALKRSTYMFLFLTKDFCTDSWAQLQRDECLMESIQNAEKKWCVIPIHEKPRKEADYELPFGLRALKGIEINQMLRGKTLDSAVVDDLQTKDIDPYFVRNMTKMLSGRIYLRRQREEKQRLELEKWIPEEQFRKWKKQEQERVEKELGEQRRALEMLKHEEELKLITEQYAARAEAARAVAPQAAEFARESEVEQNVRHSREKILGDGVRGVGNATIPVQSGGQRTGNDTVQHFYEKVVTYNFYGNIEKAQFGNYNKQSVDGHVVLDQTNLETDAEEEESTEYVVETEPVKSQRDVVGDVAVDNSAHRGEDNIVVVQERDANDRTVPRNPAVPSLNVPFPSANEAHNDEGGGRLDPATCPPEVDRPLSPPSHMSSRSVPPLCQNSVLTPPAASRESDLCRTSTTDAADSSSVRHLNAPRSNAVELLDRPSVAPRSVSVESTDRPVAAVAPIRQNSQRSSAAGNESMSATSSLTSEEETSLKLLVTGAAAKPTTKTPVKEVIDSQNRRQLSTASADETRLKQLAASSASGAQNTEDFVFVEEYPLSSGALKEMQVVLGTECTETMQVDGSNLTAQEPMSNSSSIGSSGFGGDVDQRSTNSSMRSTGSSRSSVEKKCCIS